MVNILKATAVLACALGSLPALAHKKTEQSHIVREDCAVNAWSLPVYQNMNEEMYFVLVRSTRNQKYPQIIRLSETIDPRMLRDEVIAGTKKTFDIELDDILEASKLQGFIVMNCLKDPSAQDEHRYAFRVIPVREMKEVSESIPYIDLALVKPLEQKFGDLKSYFALDFYAGLADHDKYLSRIMQLSAFLATSIPMHSFATCTSPKECFPKLESDHAEKSEL